MSDGRYGGLTDDERQPVGPERAGKDDKQKAEGENKREKDNLRCGCKRAVSSVPSIGDGRGRGSATDRCGIRTSRLDGEVQSREN